MAILDGQEGIFLSFCNKLKSGAPRESCHMSCDLSLSVSNLPPPSPLLFSSLLIVIVLQSMPTKKDPRNEVGAIVHAVANRVLSDHTAKNTVWVVPTDGKKHHVVTITHEQKWVAGVAAMITGDVADEHTSIHQWFHKDPFSERIAPGNPEHSIMSPLQAFLHMMPLGQLTLMLEPTNERLVEKEKQEMTRQELLRWIGVCVLIASINFRGRRRNLWEGGGATSKYLPSYNLRAMGMSRNRFDNIWYAVRRSHQPPEQPHGMSSEQYRWMLVDDFVANINEYRTRTFVPGGHLKADESMIRWYRSRGS